MILLWRLGIVFFALLALPLTIFKIIRWAFTGIDEVQFDDRNMYERFIGKNIEKLDIKMTEYNEEY